MERTALCAELRELPHFHGLDPERLDAVADCAVVRDYKKHEAVFHSGDPCRAFHSVRVGRVRLYRSGADGREQVVHTLGPGQSFAEAALFHFGRYPVSCEALTSPTSLLEFQGEAFRRLMRRDPELTERMVAGLCQRLLRTVARVEELSVVHAEARLARHLSNLPASCEDGVLYVDLPMAKRELAAHLAMAPETLSRQLAALRERGVIEGRGARLLVRDPDSLAAIADGDAS